MAHSGENGISLSQVRECYEKAVKGSPAALNNLLITLPTDHPVLTGYRAAAEALGSRDTWNPFEKYEHLKKAMSLLDTAIRKRPDSLEIRFLRFSIQHHIPGFVGMSDEMDEDKAIILEKLRGPDDEELGRFRNIIVRFMMESGRCTYSETKYLRGWLDNSGP